MIELVDSTRLRDSLSCLRYYYWRHERHIVPLRPPAAPLFGQAVHACLAAHYRGASLGECLGEFDAIWDGSAAEDSARNALRWVELFVAYRRFYGNEGDYLQPIEVEMPFLLRVSDDLAIVGRLDMLAHYLGRLVVVDHKTTASGADYISYNRNSQFTLYLAAASRAVGKPVTALVVNLIRLLRTVSQPERLFARIPTLRPLSLQERFIRELVSWWEVVRHCRATQSWPQNDLFCRRWNRDCAYLSLCDSLADYRELEPPADLYKEEAWNPVEELLEAN